MNQHRQDTKSTEFKNVNSNPISLTLVALSTSFVYTDKIFEEAGVKAKVIQLLQFQEM